MKAVRRPPPVHEHEFEPQPGLPEELPPGEHILWQGAPDWRVMARHAFHLRKLAVYFALMLALRGIVVLADGGTAAGALRAMAVLLPLPLVGLGLVALIAWMSARNTLYTLTDKRVVMRIGIVLTITFNLPYKRIAGADLALTDSGHGDIALALAGQDRIAWLQLWPHTRPWHFARTQPSLRALPDARRVAQTLTQAWAAANGRSASAAAPAPRAFEPGHAAVAAR
ncbi:MAG: photosynthetic complex putative assembly protein PuhB [Rubrivivax sp.]